jgi:hypothetical protein
MPLTVYSDVILVPLVIGIQQVSFLKRSVQELVLPLFPAFFIPRYTKIHGWDKSNVHVKKLGNLLTCKKEREANETNIVMKASAIKILLIF